MRLSNDIEILYLEVINVQEILNNIILFSVYITQSFLTFPLAISAYMAPRMVAMVERDGKCVLGKHGF